MIPKINFIEKNQSTKLKVLEGIEGLKQFDFNLFNLSKNKNINYIYIIGNTPPNNISTEIFVDKLLQDSKKFNFKKNIDFKGIWNYDYRKNKNINRFKLFGDNKFIKKLPSKVTILICNESVGFLIKDSPKYITVEIKNKNLAAELKFYFESLWKIAKD